MNNRLWIFLTALCAITVIACTKQEQAKSVIRQSQPLTHGTVDGGGGDVVTNPQTGSGQLLDLAEAAGKEPFDYDYETLITKELSEDQRTKSLDAIQDLHTVAVNREVMQDDADFYAWALTEVMYSNTEKSSQYHDHSIKEIYVNAFNLRDRQVINNLQYGFTDKALEEINDEGFFSVENPDTKRQLAVQDAYGNVLINHAEFNNLDLESKLALKLHESVLHLVLRFNPGLIKESGTAAIRKFVRDFFSYAYVSAVKGEPQISLEEVRTSFKALKLPPMRADYGLIKSLSLANAGKVGICTLTASPDSQVNYYFSKDGKRLTDSYAMNVEFYMKIQLQLVKKGLCIFQPADCEMKPIKSEHMEGNVLVTTSEWGLVRGEMVLPNQSNHVDVVQKTILPLYRTAKICR